MGDCNAKVGSETLPGITGGNGLGVINERGHRLIEFCHENKIVITNTMFQLSSRRLYTWESPRGSVRIPKVRKLENKSVEANNYCNKLSQETTDQTPEEEIKNTTE